MNQSTLGGSSLMLYELLWVATRSTVSCQSIPWPQSYSSCTQDETLIAECEAGALPWVFTVYCWHIFSWIPHPWSSMALVEIFDDFCGWTSHNATSIVRDMGLGGLPVGQHSLQWARCRHRQGGTWWERCLSIGPWYFEWHDSFYTIPRFGTLSSNFFDSTSS